MEGLLLLDGELTAVEELFDTVVLAAAVAVELAMALAKVMVECLTPPRGPHPPWPGWFCGTASTKGEAANVSSRRHDSCMMTGLRRRIIQRETKCKG